MFGERLFYFIHGVATMFFLMEGIRRLWGCEISRQKRLCGYILLYWAFLELKDLLFYALPIVRNDYFTNLLVIFDMTAVPVGICFAIEFIYTGWCTLRRIFLMALPFIMAFILYLFLASDIVFDALFIYTGLYSVGMLMSLYIAIKKHNRMVVENFSNTDNISVNWLWRIAVMVVICFALWTFSCYFTSWVVDSCYQLALLVMWFIFLYFADRQKVVKLQQAPEIKNTDDVETHLGAKLEQLMNEDKVWKNPRLSLVDLAMMIGTNRTYLSNYLNNTLNTTFYDYINGYRIKAALSMLHNADATTTMVEIAENSGFNSISTFRRVFRRVNGCSFGEYRQKNNNW